MKEAIDLCELIDRFGDDQKGRNYLEHSRWRALPEVQLRESLDQYDYDSCRYQFSVTAGTPGFNTCLLEYSL